MRKLFALVAVLAVHSNLAVASDLETELVNSIIPKDKQEQLIHNGLIKAANAQRLTLITADIKFVLKTKSMQRTISKLDETDLIAVGVVKVKNADSVETLCRAVLPIAWDVQALDDSPSPLRKVARDLVLVCQ